MRQNVDYIPALNNLARIQASYLLTSEGDAEEKLRNLVFAKLRELPQDYVISAYEQHQHIEKHTHHETPAHSGMYLKLLHGRKYVNEKLDDWGFDGPWIGPLKWFHCTYLSSIGIGFEDGTELVAMMPDGELPSPMFFVDDLLYFYGMYYGDWELQSI